jgi:hypothetical protein
MKKLLKILNIVFTFFQPTPLYFSHLMLLSQIAQNRHQKYNNDFSVLKSIFVTH